jgi:uncharacterized protein YjdB
MSKICEKCGNMIPDGVDVCPNCGREDDSAIEAVMNDLSKAFADLGAPEPKKPAAKPETPVSDDETILFHLDEVKEAEKKAEKPAEDADSQNLNAAIEAAMKQLDETVPEIPVVEPPVEDVTEEIEEPEEISEEAADDPIIPTVTETTKHSDAPKPRKAGSGSGKKPQGQPAKRSANGSKNRQPKKKRPQESQRPKTSSGHPTNAKKKKKKKKKDNSKTLLGIVIGLIVVLVVIVGAAFGMLYKLGFFETMTDDELLGTTTSQVVSEAPSATPEPTPEATEATEASSIEEENTVLPSGSAEDENTPVDASSSIEVKKFKITGAEYITLYSRGETTEVVYVIDPSDAKNSIEWESSDETIATVSDYGVITARRGGTCTVTGTCGDASITVYVTCDFTVPSTVLDMNYEDVTMNHEGQTLELAIDYDLTADQIKNTVWESSDETVATVSDKGVVTAVADGTAVITASIAEYTASCIVRCVNVTGNKGVNSSESEYVINYEDVTLTRKGEYFQLTLKSVVGNEVPAFTWKSSDTKVATVDSKGVVTAVANGTCKITTSIGDDDFECVVRVNISG